MISYVIRNFKVMLKGTFWSPQKSSLKSKVQTFNQSTGGDECAESHAHAEEIREHVKPSQSSADDPTANIPEI